MKAYKALDANVLTIEIENKVEAQLVKGNLVSYAKSLLATEHYGDFKEVLECLEALKEFIDADKTETVNGDPFREWMNND